MVIVPDEVRTTVHVWLALDPQLLRRGTSGGADTMLLANTVTTHAIAILNLDAKS